MKRYLLTAVALLCSFLSFSQLQEDFDPAPSGWILSQGANFQTVSTNGAVVTPGVGGNNPASIGTPAVNKTSNTFEVCFNVKAYSSNLNSQQSFPCNTYVDVLFVKATVNSASDAELPANILARVDNYLLPMAGGNSCFSFSFPAGVTDASFKVFLSFHSGCNQGGIKYVIDDMSISGVSLICGGVNCPPGASADVFNRPFEELGFNAVLYGSPIDISYPSVPSGFAVDPTGTDGDQNDTYPHLRWTLVSGPTNGTVVVNANGTATITRNSYTVTSVTFTYLVCDDGPDNDFLTTADNLCSTPVTVTANWPAGRLLPVTLTSFTAARSRNNVNLKWETATEINNAGFEIYRSVGNAGFQKIGFVATKATDGNSNNKISYEFTDANSSKDVTLYQLKQLDRQGKFSVSEIKTVRGEGSSFSVTVFPTPSITGNVSVAVSGLQAYDVYVTDMNGRVLKEFKRASTDNVKISNLQSGMYVIKVVDLKTGEQSSEKIIVNRR